MREKFDIPFKQLCCKECAKAYRRAYYKLNKDRMRKMHRSYYYQNRGQRLKYGKWYQQEHRAEITQKIRDKKRAEYVSMLAENPLYIITNKYAHSDRGKPREQVTNNNGKPKP
jgi:uncharacterized membrane protein